MDRKAELANEVFQFVFQMLDSEDGVEGLDAGLVAAACQVTFEQRYQQIVDEAGANRGADETI